MAEHGRAAGRPTPRTAARAVEGRVLKFLGRHHTLVQGMVDGVSWSLAIIFATLFRYDFHASRLTLRGMAVAIPVTLLIQGLAGLAAGLYTGRSRFGSFEEVVSLVRATAVAGAVLALFISVVHPQPVPASVPVVAGLVALVLMGGVRYMWRLALERRRRPNGENCHRLLIFGAGEGAVRVIPALLRDPGSTYLPVGLLDDDPAKRKLRIMGVPVLGTRQQLAEAAQTTRADTLLIAIPTAGADLVTEVSELARVAGVAVKILPPVWELFEGNVDASDIRDVTTADLLGRHEIHTDVESIAGYLTGKRVLVTGAGGSIGSELCQQIYRFAPDRLIMLDRDESALHKVQLAIEGRALLESPDLVLVDLRDREAVERVFAETRPEVVFHAAALKHLTLLELNPGEAIKTNVWSTLDLLEITASAGVKRFVNISTDKAADPCSVLGYSKRVTERLTSHFAATAPGTYLSVRFGNVLGSRGSVLTAFQAQIERGGPITVTDPEVTRFFMTVEEAVQLVIQAGAIGGNGEALVLDMGKPVVIAEVARLMAARADRRIAIEFTGLRKGEKLHEVLLATNEVDVRPAHPLISHVAVPPLEPGLARDIEAMDRPDRVIPALARLASEGHDAGDGSSPWQTKRGRTGG
ncbi:MAG TPA: nucleoside-diphosphate sugar epimerase/dehydratase [Acidimicrobiales bacterium]|nr:nucleoside-diphosphate sugar epimerase/dehydratase [Acidimicrobiales bacterium]